MTGESNQLGTIQIAPRAIASLAHRAAIQTYGVVGLASKNIMNGLTRMIVRDPTYGIDVRFVDEKINIEIYIIVEYGTRIKEVAGSVASAVRYNVEKALGLSINEINVHVQGLHISEPNE
jgi:uncharacterized alkaline shock family protein YloU